VLAMADGVRYTAAMAFGRNPTRQIPIAYMLKHKAEKQAGLIWKQG